MKYWYHGGRGGYPIPTAFYSRDQFSIVGWLLRSFGTDRMLLDLGELEPGDRPQVCNNHLFKHRVLTLPKALNWFADPVIPTDLALLVGGELGVPRPCCLADIPDPHGNDMCKPNYYGLIQAINGAIVDCSGAKLRDEDRAFWLREVVRTKGLGVQFL